MTLTRTEFSAAAVQDGDRAIIELTGEINGLADVELASAYAEAEASGPSQITLDFNQVDYINSTGIALIVGLLAKARMAQIPLAAVGLTDHYREIFTITRLSDFIDIR